MGKDLKDFQLDLAYPRANFNLFRVKREELKFF